MNIFTTCNRQPWNKGKLVGQKTPLRLRDIWAIRVRLQIAERTRDLAIDRKLRACDLTKLRVRDVAHGDRVSLRAMVMQQKTQRPVQFEITDLSQDEEPASGSTAARSYEAGKYRSKSGD